MNKWQIICPLVAFAIVGIVFVVHHTTIHRRIYVNAMTRSVGYELIKATNSTHLVGIGSGLQKRLTEFLSAPAGVAEVLIGDEQPPIGDGTACSRLILSNATGGRLGIRFRSGSASGTFQVAGFWTIAEPNGNWRFAH